MAAQSVSPGFYAAYSVALEAVLAAVCTALGVIIFWRRSDHRMALVASLILVTFGLTFSDAAARSRWTTPPGGCRSKL